ncbi:hypothetical protein [Leptolyngbya sp. FACHB-321]|uniref:hypothetical protein n=1 Tax=Leptolyngbya sp. FACHB-321 TaxID=2692807 RepID=UPI001F54A8E1|nr:hypothetical protein [Leptolyngbya sp. FACHB-321]
MTTKIYEKSFISFKRHLADYLPQLERAISAIKVLETTDPDSEAFSLGTCRFARRINCPRTLF